MDQTMGSRATALGMFVASVSSATIDFITPMLPFSRPARHRLSRRGERTDQARSRTAAHDDERPERCGEAERHHGDRETEQVDEEDGFAAYPVRESAPVQHGARFGHEEERLLERVGSLR